MAFVKKYKKTYYNNETELKFEKRHSLSDSGVSLAITIFKGRVKIHIRNRDKFVSINDTDLMDIIEAKSKLQEHIQEANKLILESNAWKETLNEEDTTVLPKSKFTQKSENRMEKLKKLAVRNIELDSSSSGEENETHEVVQKKKRKITKKKRADNQPSSSLLDTDLNEIDN